MYYPKLILPDIIGAFVQTSKAELLLRLRARSRSQSEDPKQTAKLGPKVARQSLIAFAPNSFFGPCVAVALNVGAYAGSITSA